MRPGFTALGVMGYRDHDGRPSVYRGWLICGLTEREAGLYLGRLAPGMKWTRNPQDHIVCTDLLLTNHEYSGLTKRQYPVTQEKSLSLQKSSFFEVNDNTESVINRRINIRMVSRGGIISRTTATATCHRHPQDSSCLFASSLGPHYPLCVGIQTRCVLHVLANLNILQENDCTNRTIMIDPCGGNTRFPFSSTLLQRHRLIRNWSDNNSASTALNSSNGDCITTKKANKTKYNITRQRAQSKTLLSAFTTSSAGPPRLTTAFFSSDLIIISESKTSSCVGVKFIGGAVVILGLANCATCHTQTGRTGPNSPGWFCRTESVRSSSHQSEEYVFVTSRMYTFSSWDGFMW
ncbi:hypothetical protein J6590_013844 [Homalodisca vitripennis]|nr:hypothetical protein J6590_013844 [Homalodisca vitripennis]